MISNSIYSMSRLSNYNKSIEERHLRSQKSDPICWDQGFETLIYTKFQQIIKKTKIRKIIFQIQTVICSFIGIFWNIFRSILRRDWCERRDSNPYALRYKHLKLARLPISPLSHYLCDPDEIRTHDHRLRKPILYPPELRDHRHHKRQRHYINIIQKYNKKR